MYRVGTHSADEAAFLLSRACACFCAPCWKGSFTVTILMTVLLASMIAGCLLVGALAALSAAEAKREMRRIASVSRRRPVSHRQMRPQARQSSRGSGYSA